MFPTVGLGTMLKQQPCNAVMAPRRSGMQRPPAVSRQPCVDVGAVDDQQCSTPACHAGMGVGLGRLAPC